MLPIVEDQIAELKKLWKINAYCCTRASTFAMIVFSALMIWKGLMFLTKSESPVVVVLSGSMEMDVILMRSNAHEVIPQQPGQSDPGARSSSSRSRTAIFLSCIA